MNSNFNPITNKVHIVESNPQELNATSERAQNSCMSSEFPLGGENHLPEEAPISKVLGNINPSSSNQEVTNIAINAEVAGFVMDALNDHAPKTENTKMQETLEPENNRVDELKSIIGVTHEEFMIMENFLEVNKAVFSSFENPVVFRGCDLGNARSILWVPEKEQLIILPKIEAGTSYGDLTEGIDFKTGERCDLSEMKNYMHDTYEANPGLSNAAFDDLTNFYNNNKPDLENMGEVVFFRGAENGLQRSLLYIPDKGMCILPEIQMGSSYANVTEGINLETGQKHDLSEASEILQNRFELKAEWGINGEEFKKLNSYSEENKISFEKNSTIEFTRGADHDLPRSLLFIPGTPEENPFSGIWMLLKQHGGAEQIGAGEFNRVTTIVNIKTGKEMALRTCKKEDMQEAESDALKETAKYTQYFASGPQLFYRGPIHERSGKLIGNPRATTKSDDKDNVDKFLVVMEKGTSLDKIYEKSLPLEESLKISTNVAKGLQILHDELKIVWLDGKPSNIIITEDGRALISDLGLSSKIGGPSWMAGSRGYKPPEIFYSKITGGIASAPMDIWTHGLILADLMGLGRNFRSSIQDIPDYDEDKKVAEELKTLVDKKLETVKIRIEKDYNAEIAEEYTNLIKECLVFDPLERPLARELAKREEALLEKIIKLRDLRSIS